MLIYKVTNNKTGKSYIGQTCRTLEIRKSEHLQSASNIRKTKYPTPLHTAIRENGKTEFTWEILEMCASLTHLNEREKFYIKLLNTKVPNGYNQTTGGAMDESMSEDIRDRISESMAKVHQDPAYRAKVYPKLKGLIPPNKGIPMSDAQKAKVSAAKKATYADPTYINPNVGQKRTEEQKARIKAGQEGKMPLGEVWAEAHKDQYTPEVRAKMRAKKLGKKPANTKKIQCIESGIIYEGLTDASKALNVNRQSIWLQIKGKINKAGGLTFKFI